MHNKTDKAHAVAALYATSVIPDSVKQAVIWEQYWTLRTEASHKLRCHSIQMAKLKELRATTAAVMRHRLGSAPPQTLAQVDCKIFVLALQEPKFRFVFGGAPSHP